MGRPGQHNKAQTPVGYSHGTGVSTGGLGTAVLGVVARGCARSCLGAGDIVAGGTVHVLRRPLGVLHGVAGTACRPRERRGSGDVWVEGCDSKIVRRTVLRAYLRRRGSLGGALTRSTRSSR